MDEQSRWDVLMSTAHHLFGHRTGMNSVVNEVNEAYKAVVRQPLCPRDEDSARAT